MTHSRTRHVGALLLVLSLFSPVTRALEFECRAPGDTRYLRLELPGRDHLCEVSMTFGTGGERRVMWYADNDSQFCSTKTYELRDKYVDTWEFDCTEWPDQDGVDRLSALHRRILDRQLIRLRQRATDNPDAALIQGVRATADNRDSADNPAPGLLALQFFYDDGSDLLRILVDDKDGGDVLAEVSGLAEVVDPIDGFNVVAAYIDSISDSSALTVVTVLAPRDRGDRDTAAFCEGQQTLRVAGPDSLLAVSPHRHVCR